MSGESPLGMMRPPAQRLPKRAAGRRPRRLWPILAPPAIVLVLAVAWVWLWYYAASVADRTLAGWVEREEAAGRFYACGSQSIGGFPLRIDVNCSDPSAEIRNQAPPYAVKAKTLGFVAEVWHPTELTGTIGAPVSLAVAGEPPRWIADWARSRIVVRGLPPDPEGFSVRLDDTHVDDALPAGHTIFRAKTADLQGRVTAGSPHDHPVIEVTLHLAGANAPGFHPLLAEPTDVEIVAILRGFKDLAPKPWAERVREMQATADGGIEIKSLRLAQANAMVVGAGSLTVNANGKLDGLVRIAVVGIERLVPLLAVDRLISQGIDQLAGSQGAAAQGMSALDRLVPGLGGALRQSVNTSLVENLKKMGQPTSIDKQPAIVLPLRFADGAVYLGMLRIGEAPALF
jgi:hypothetical protein